MALFGAIVAVGLGPALWMGVQLGPDPQQAPLRPPVVGQQGAEKAGHELLGGTGAGEQTSKAGIDADPRANVLPLTSAPMAEPSRSASSTPEPSRSTTAPTTEPTATTEPTEPTEPADPTGPGATSPTEPTDPASPSESTTAPTTDPAETDGPLEDETSYPPDDDEDWTYEDPAPDGGRVGNFVSSNNR
ncbi:hypothetical protein [Actinoplanes sp. M2I2]|uniref:hypothetical protein n=1 Tax=Actinoplanes sp. M2I2 TaxID=1734444 RepID=UPI00202144D0|nr:hypothetical protein [Actinoplanes sp. M2I2]